MKLSVVFLFTFMGTPCIFYGDEVGLSGDGDPDCRQCMEWDPEKQDLDLYDFYRMMISLRKNFPALRQGRFRFLQANRNDPSIVYERADDQYHFIIWMNNSEEKRTLSHPIVTTDWYDALLDEPVKPVDGTMHIELEPYGYRILCRKLKSS